MGAVDAKSLIRRLERLELLADAYGHILIASELDRALPGLIPVLAAGGRGEAEAAGVLKEILQRGGPQLLAELDDVERTARQVRDLEVFAVLNRVRQTFHHIARYNAAAVLRRLEHSGQATPEAGSLQKEIQAFQRAVARLEPGTHDVEDVFGDEDPAATDAGAPAPIEPSMNGPARSIPADSPAPTEAPSFQTAEPEDAPSSPAPWSVAVESPRGDQADGAAPESAAATADWLQDRVEVFNAMLLAWAYNDPLNPDASPLVRRGRFTAGQFQALYRELLEQGAARLVEMLAGIGDDSREGDRLRLLCSRIVDGAIATVPRLLGALSGGQLQPDADGTAVDARRVRADLIDYLSQAADLYPPGTGLRDRLLYLAAELRTVADASP